MLNLGENQYRPSFTSDDLAKMEKSTEEVGEKKDPINVPEKSGSKIPHSPSINLSEVEEIRTLLWE